MSRVRLGRAGNVFSSVLGCVALLACGVGVAVYLVKTKPKVERKKPPVVTPLVVCQSLERQTGVAEIAAMGSVLPAVTVELKARVAGVVESVHTNWYPGGAIAAGEELLRIDDADYRVALLQATSEVTQARSDLLLEQGRQDVARQEWKLLGPDDGGSELDRMLALREPQLMASEARVAGAEARLQRAHLDHSRTQSS